MNGAFYIAATGLGTEQRALDVVANNIANVNTPGYKRSQMRFSELVSSTGQTTDIASQQASLTGSMLDTASRVFAQGELKPTGQPLDIAIDGEGFIELLGPGGQVMLWRGGSMKVDEDGYLAASNGMPLKAMISTPLNATSVSIDANGKVQAVVPGASKPEQIGQVDLVRVKDTATLKVMDEGLYQPASESDLFSAAPGEDGAGMLVPGSIEGSNVQLTDEMVTLLLLQRAYAANAQVVQAGDQLMAIANSLRR